MSTASLSKPLQRVHLRDSGIEKVPSLSIFIFSISFKKTSSLGIITAKPPSGRRSVALASPP
jgi:hypothetical protein